MNFFLPPEIEAVRDMVSRFMANEVVPVMEDYEKRQEFPRELIRKAGEAGLYGAVFPESVGGSDMGYMAAAVIIEEMARQEVRFTSCNNQQGGTCPTCIYLGGTPEQVQKYVPNLLAGKTIGMMSLSESGSGSDAAGAMKTFAKRDGDVYQINGEKMWASIANETDVGILFAKTDRDAGAKGVTAFIVEPKKYPGFTAKPIDLLGMSKAFRTNIVHLDDFVVPVENRLGEEGEGFKIIMRALQPGRLNIAAKCVGLAQACFEEAMRYANERTVRGGPIGKFQMIQDFIAEMATVDRGEPRAGLQDRLLHGQRAAVQPHRRDREVPRLADGQDVRRQGAADLRRLRTGARIPRVVDARVCRHALQRRRLGQHPEDHHRRGRARLQARRPPPRQDRPARRAADGRRRDDDGRRLGDPDAL